MKEYTICTTEWWDGDLDTPLYDTLSDSYRLARRLNKFNYRGACWEEVIVRENDTVLLHWKREPEKYTFDEDIDILEKAMKKLVCELWDRERQSTK